MEGQSIRHALDGFFEELRLEGKSPRTLQTYRSLLKLPDGYVHELTPEVCRRLVGARLDQSRNTAHTFAAALRSFLIYLDLDIAVPRPRKLDRPHRFLTRDEVRRMWGHCPEDTRNGFLLLLSGLRASEALGLRWQDVDGDIGRILGKGHKHRAIVLPEGVTRHGDYVVGLSYRQLKDRIVALGRKAKIPYRVTPHALRHAFASNAILEGMDSRTLQTLGGWAKAETLQIYTKSALEQAALERAREFRLVDRLLE